MARAKVVIETEKGGLYERDFCLWVEEQLRLLRAGQLERLDVANLIEEIESLGISRKHAVTSAIVVILKHLLKYHYQPQRRSRSWLSSIAEHRRRVRKEFQHAPSLRPYAGTEFEDCYRDARRQALIETGLAAEAVPETPSHTLDQTLDPDFLPD
jgi:Domain of unknown function DUF29